MTGRVGVATNAAVYSLTGIVLIYWFNCRHTFSKSKFTIAQTQRAFEEMDRQRGTDSDPLIDPLGENQTKD